MATSVVPSLLRAIAASSYTALPDLRVTRGFGVSDDPGDYLMVGVSDPELDEAANAADARQDWATVGRQGARSEQGEVTCVAYSWNGDQDQDAATTSAYEIVAAVEDFCRQDPDLGISTLLWSSALVSHQLFENQDDRGALAMVTFRIGFQARI